MTQHIVIKPSTPVGVDDVVELQEVSCGSHFQEFLDYQKTEIGLDDKGVMNLRNSSCNILSYCNPHDAVDNPPTTHLVVGYVQSGKTMSFTSLIELALDNHYKVVIVLAGIATNLLQQTDDRLGDDLVCGKEENYRYFKIHKNPDEGKALEIARNLKMKDSILIINVLKHAGRISHVRDIFLNAEIKELLKNETALIIDDEADQASLNNFGRANSNANNDEAQMSSTYEAIFNLRNALPGNSYVQYTATPQANILISTLDMLSPKTHTLLTPGKGYCGGKLFFGVGEEGKRFDGGLIIQIPREEVFNAKNNPLKEIPHSLETALMLHTWAVIINTRIQVNVNQLSMMVHTDVTLQWNRQFYKWINETISDWIKTLESPGYSVKRYNLEKKFENAYTEAVKFYQADSFEYNELKGYIHEVLCDTRVYLYTGDSDDKEDLDWKQFSSNILVGAQMLNRGFTVKNLTTTYMPRYTTGITNADTIEQRCRFFGYKEKYIRSCRVFLPQVSIDNYKNYITSEEELRAIMAETKSLEECGHKILSYSRLRPTRTNVLPPTVVTTSLSGTKEFAPYNNQSMMNSNKKVVDAFIEKNASIIEPFSRPQYNYNNYKGDRAHTAFRVSVDDAIRFLKMMQFGTAKDIRANGDTIRYMTYLRDSDIISDVVFVSMSEGRYKKRSLDTTNAKLISSTGKESNVFNGPSNVGDSNHYLGDRAMFVDDTITIQLHHLEFANLPGVQTATVAINYPQKLSVQYTKTC